MQIRTDDDVYRVDAVWLGPPRATFPWRARYSSYGVGLLVMIFVMFVQRRLGIDLGFFSVAWALLITVVVTRFVGRRIDEDRPLLEWLTLFAHELRGPRRRTQGVGGPLSAGHVRVRRDRPRLTASPTAVALPRGSGSPDPDARVIPTRVRVRPTAADPSADAAPRTPTPRAPSSRPAAARSTSSRAGSRSTAGRSSAGDPTTRFVRSSRPDREDTDDGFGPPTATTVGAPVEPAAEETHGSDGPAGRAALPPAPPPSASAAATVASWRRARGDAASSDAPARDRVRVPSARVDRDRQAARAARPPRPGGGGARRFGPSSAGRPDPDRVDDADRGPAPGHDPSTDDAAEVPSSFGPGTRRTRPDREGDGAAP